MGKGNIGKLCKFRCLSVPLVSRDCQLLWWLGISRSNNGMLEHKALLFSDHAARRPKSPAEYGIFTAIADDEQTTDG